MKTKIFLLSITFLLINFVVAQSFCVDFDPPSAPSNLILTQSNTNIQLNWEPATDQPSCSGIDFYDIYKNNNFLISIEETNYLDTGLSDGTYTYTIYAFDLAGHNEGVGISKTITIGSTTNNNGKTPSSGGGGGGGSSSSDDFSYWQCGEWQECIEGIQKRTCTDLSENLPDKTETKECFSDFIPLTYGTTEHKKETTELTADNQEPKNAFAKITGAVTGTLGTGGTVGAFVFILGIIGAFVFVKFKRK